MRIRIAAPLQVLAQNGRLDGPVVLTFAPVAKVAVAEAVGVRRVGEQADHPVLGQTFRAGSISHRAALVAWCLKIPLPALPPIWPCPDRRRRFVVDRFLSSHVISPVDFV